MAAWVAFRSTRYSATKRAWRSFRGTAGLRPARGVRCARLDTTRRAGIKASAGTIRRRPSTRPATVPAEGIEPAGGDLARPGLHRQLTVAVAERHAYPGVGEG